jgi:hypothetical protein
VNLQSPAARAMVEPNWGASQDATAACARRCGTSEEFVAIRWDAGSQSGPATYASRDFGQTITDELYEQARDQLFASGQIGRLRGQGGQVFLAKSENRRVPEAESSEALSESELMPHLEPALARIVAWKKSTNVC